MSTLTPRQQAIFLTLLTAAIYIFLARPVEKVTRFVLVGDKVYLTAGPAGFRVLDIRETTTSAPGDFHPHGIRYGSRPVPVMIGSYNTLGQSNSLVVRDQLAFIADGNEGVIVLDISDPHNPKKVGDTEIGGNALDLALWKDLIFVAAGRNGLRVVNAKTEGDKKGQVNEVQEARLGGRAEITRVFGDRLYVGGDEKLTIYNLKEGNKKPEQVGAFPVKARVWDVQVVERKGRQVAFLAADEDGILGLDVTEPMSITVKLKFDTPGRAMGVDIYDGYALVADGRQGLQVYDITDEENVRQIGKTFQTWNEVTQVIADASVVFVADGVGGLRVLEYGILMSTEVDGGIPQASAERIAPIAPHRPYVFLANGGRGLRALRSENLQEITFSDTPGFAGAVDIRWQDALAIVADKDDLLVMDFAEVLNPYHPTPQIHLRGRLGAEAGNEIQDVQLSADGKLAYVANGKNGFWVVNLTDPTKPKVAGKEAIVYQAVDIDLIGNYVFVAGANGGLNVVNVQDPEFPTRVFPRDSSKTLLTDVRAVDAIRITDNLTYVYAATKEGMCIIRVLDPKNPEKLVCLDAKGSANDVVVDPATQRVYLATERQKGSSEPDQAGAGRLYIYAVSASNWENPQLVSESTYEFPIKRVSAYGNEIYLMAGEHGLHRVLFQDPGLTVASYTLPTLTRQFVKDGDFIYAVDGSDAPGRGGLGLSILDVSNRKKASQVGLYRSPGQPSAVALHPDKKIAYLADGERGLRVVDISDKVHPVSVNHLDVPGRAVHLAVKGKRLYVALAEGGLGVFDISNSRAPIQMATLGVGGAGGLPGPAMWVEGFDEYAFVACENAGLSSVLISDLRRPQLLDTYREYPDVRRFTIDLNEKRLYAGAGADGMVIYNIEKPGRIEIINRYQTSAPAEHAFALRPYIFVAIGDRGVQVLLAEDPMKIVPVGASPVRKPAEVGLAVMVYAEQFRPEEKGPTGFVLYVAESARGLRFYTVQKKLLLYQSGVYETPGTAGIGEVFNYIVTRINALVNQSRELLRVIGLGFLETPIKWVQEKVDSLIRAVVRRLGNDPWPLTGASPKAGWTLQRVLFFDGLVLGWFGLLFWAAFVAQFVLPVQEFEERGQAARRLWAFICGRHGTMTRVFNGQIMRPPDDAEWRGPGVALVDVVSAAVLEKRLHPRGTLGELIAALLGRRDPPPEAPFGAHRETCWEQLRRAIDFQRWPRLNEDGIGFWRRVRFYLGWLISRQISPIPPERVAGRSLVFTETGSGRLGPSYDEVVRHSVDLRRQFRISGQEVLAHTRDGIELRTLVFCIFTLGQKADTLLVTYEDGIPECEKLRVVYLDEVFYTARGRGGQRRAVKRHRVRELSEELDREDLQEIHNYVQEYKRRLARGGALRDMAEAQDDDFNAPGQPFSLDPARVFAAAASRADDRSADNQPEWHELPVRTAVEVYRNLLAQEDYDSLYQSPDGGREFPLQKFRQVIGRRVRNLGVINFQYIERVDGLPIKKGDELAGPQDKFSSEAGEAGDLRWYPVRQLTFPKVLRARGIKIIAASPTVIRPVNDEVRRYLLETWLARWRTRTEMVRTPYVFKAQEIRGQARAEAQRTMYGIFNTIFAADLPSEEAMALRVLQALETVAADPLTRQFLPNETITMLETLHRWLLPST
jgi:hypothetical protein